MWQRLQQVLAAIGGLTLLVLLGNALAPNSRQQNVPTVATSPNTAPSPNAAPSVTVTPLAVPLATWAEVKDDRAAKINRSEIAPRIPSNNQFLKSIEPKGGKLVVVYLSLKNTGKESGNTLGMSFQIFDDQGRKYEELDNFEETTSLTSWLSSKKLATPAEQLFPGGSLETAKVFRLAPDAKTFRLVINGKDFTL